MKSKLLFSIFVLASIMFVSSCVTICYKPDPSTENWMPLALLGKTVLYTNGSDTLRLRADDKLVKHIDKKVDGLCVCMATYSVGLSNEQASIGYGFRMTTMSKTSYQNNSFFGASLSSFFAPHAPDFGFSVQYDEFWMSSGFRVLPEMTVNGRTYKTVCYAYYPDVPPYTDTAYFTPYYGMIQANLSTGDCWTLVPTEE